MYIDDATIAAIDAWLDSGAGEDYQAQPLAQDWARVSKVAEELGEAVSEFILATRQNPRKAADPAAHGRMLKEIADVIVCGMVCLQHFTKDTDVTNEVIYANLRKITGRNPEILGAIP
jgi:phosphoribosyl-ATP pyrophosphohydrolase